MKPSLSTTWAALGGWLLCLALLAVSSLASAGPTDISNVPPSTLTASTVRPNLMFILDDSGSMDSTFLPDEVGADADLKCYGYAGHNRVFFNPGYVYPLPSDGNGAKLSAATFTAAKDDGFVSGSSAIDLSKPANLPFRYLTSTVGPVNC